MIRKVQISDREKIKIFFEIMITDTYQKEGVGHLLDIIENEIKSKMSSFEKAIVQEELMYVDIEDEKIIAVGALIPCSGLIIQCTPELSHLTELASILVHYDYQNQGYGTKIVDYLIEVMVKDGQKSFCLDSGYTIAKKIWTKKFGTPYKIMKDFWGEGADHYVWHIFL